MEESCVVVLDYENTSLIVAPLEVAVFLEI